MKENIYLVSLIICKSSVWNLNGFVFFYELYKSIKKQYKKYILGNYIRKIS